MKTINGLKFSTFDEMLEKQMKQPGFKEGYYKELARLELVSEMRKVRGLKKMTQKKLAEKAQMPQSVIARIESGKRGISLSTLVRIAGALGKQIKLV